MLKHVSFGNSGNRMISHAPRPQRSEFPWMSFVDGENFAIRAQQVAESHQIELHENQWWQKDVFAWIPGKDARQAFIAPAARPQPVVSAVRAYYYTSVAGNGVDEKIREKLWDLGFDPQVFRKGKGSRSKGVDITLTRDMLSHAFRGNFDVALLFAGDGDYVPLVEEVKRIGKSVHLCFFHNGLNPRLRLAADHFTDLTELFVSLRQACMTKAGPVG